MLIILLFIISLLSIIYLIFKNINKKSLESIPTTDFPNVIHEETSLHLDDLDDKHGKDMGMNNKKEVYNIDKNKYTYEEAKEVCNELNAELATLSQLQIAYKDGANWCNYGWSADGMALYPIQQDYYDMIQNSELKGTCGKPGINGGKFDKKAKLGINCYGIRPRPREGRIIYEEEKKNTNNINLENIDIRPFSDETWSKYSFKKSSYLLDSDILNKVILHENVNYDEIDPRIISENLIENENTNTDDIMAENLNDNLIYPEENPII